MEVPAPDVHTVAEALALLVANEADPAEWGAIVVASWKDAGIIGKPGNAGFVIIDRTTGRQWVIRITERVPRAI